jgi:hypothetical protein
VAAVISAFNIVPIRESGAQYSELPKPDLAVKGGFNFPNGACNGATNKVVARIYNTTGALVIQSFRVTLRVKETTQGGSLEPDTTGGDLYQVVVNGLKPGAILPVAFDNVVLPSSVPYGSQEQWRRLTVAVDPDNKVTESNKANNVYSQQIAPTCTQESDLQVAELKIINGLGGGPCVGTDNYVRVVVTNSEWTTSQQFTVRVRVKGPQSNDQGDVYEQTLNGIAHAGILLSAFNVTLPTVGSYQFTAILDPANQVAESVETNNSKSVTQSVQLACP